MWDPSSSARRASKAAAILDAQGRCLYLDEQKMEWEVLGFGRKIRGGLSRTRVDRLVIPLGTALRSAEGLSGPENHRLSIRQS